MNPLLPVVGQHRLAGLRFFLLPLVLAGLLLRLVFIVQSWAALPHDPSLAGAVVVGLCMDLVYAGYFLSPVALYLVLVPQRLFRHAVNRASLLVALAATVWLVLFNAVAEWIFWDEFGVRFNFIAVDYLVYTTEVIDNILESYPVLEIFAAIAAVSVLVALTISRLPGYRQWLGTADAPRSRLRTLAAVILVPVVLTAIVDGHNLPQFDNRYAQEISRNGQYSFFAAFRDNELDYHTFYLDEPDTIAARRIRDLVAEPDAEFAPAADVPERRQITAAGAERRYNVIQITVESLSADFLGRFGNPEHLTPNLDAIAEDSLLFTNFMATGTRTVRGMESLTLSVPPTPGRSIVKRPHNAVLESTGNVFAAKGYEPAFFYGGYGYFDNMNDFFAGNGFSIHDRGTETEADVVFTNAWGVSDGDLYRWVLEDADRKHAAGQPFFDFVMTTSNHRPYTYPEGRIDIPSHSGRAGAVKYTDYAIGRFIDAARQRPWFENTVFVIVADHCAGSAGKTKLPVENYHIPLMIYAPGIVQPAVVETLASQIDFAPTLFGIMNWSYDSEFFGRDVRDVPTEQGRALIGTYQNVGLYEDDQQLTVLSPGKTAEAFHFDAASGEQRRVDLSDTRLTDAITYYQRAADLYARKSRTAT